MAETPMAFFYDYFKRLNCYDFFNKVVFAT
jgi:hypothetical protein